jgi:hypothetical protein
VLVIKLGLDLAPVAWVKHRASLQFGEERLLGRLFGVGQPIGS